MATVTVGYSGGVSMNDLNLNNLALGTATTYNSTTFVVDYGNGLRDNFSGTGFNYNVQNGTVTPTSGIVTHYTITNYGATVIDFANGSIPVSDLLVFYAQANTQGALAELLSGNDTISGGSGPDTLYGYGGDDAMRGNGGNDILDGGAGTDTAVYSGAFANYTITHRSDGGYTVTDTRSGAPDGSDMLYNIERIQFSDQADPLMSSKAFVIRGYHQAVLRTDPTQGYDAGTFASEVQASEFGGATSAASVAAVVQDADNTTSVATLAYQFFTGHTPSVAGLDYLLFPTGGNPNNLNSTYYAQFSTTNRYINFASNLGKLGEGAAAFQAAYGSLSLADATSKAYAAIFGSTPTADKVSHLLNDLVPNGAGGTYAREDYFAYYGQDGLNGQGTKAAMVGWLLGQAASADVGTFQTANIAYLTDVANGRASGSVDLVGTYHGTPYTGG